MIGEAILLVLEPSNLAVIVICTLYGAFVGAMPGLTATMAVSLLVPFTFFMDPVPAISAIVATTTTAIFAGDIAGALLRMPGTPASAAYVEDSFRLSQRGLSRSTLLVSLITAAIGGIAGVLILSLIAPQLARFAIGFSSFERFWLAALGLTCAVFAGSGTASKNLVSLFIGLFIATIGIDVAVGHPRFTFGSYELFDGVSFIPAMIGMFALSEVLRAARRGRGGAAEAAQRLALARLEPMGAALKRAGAAIARYKTNIARSSVLGAGIGALPGAGADIAAWICYAISRRFSKEPGAYGKGHVEGVADGGAANNAAVAGAWTPALAFGIPGDSVTAIAIGVLLMKGLTPGPQIFETDAELINALFGSFLVANVVMLISGGLAVMAASLILKAPRSLLMPLVLLASLVGGYAITNSVTAIWIILALGLIAYVMEENGIPMAPAILGIVLGKVLEDNFMTSMIKAQGDLLAFFERDYAFALGLFTLALWAALLVQAALQTGRAGAAKGAGDGAAGASADAANDEERARS